MTPVIKTTSKIKITFDEAKTYFPSKFVGVENNTTNSCNNGRAVVGFRTYPEPKNPSAAVVVYFWHRAALGQSPSKPCCYTDDGSEWCGSNLKGTDSVPFVCYFSPNSNLSGLTLFSHHRMDRPAH